MSQAASPHDVADLTAGGSTLLATDTAEAVHWAFAGLTRPGCRTARLAG